MASSVRFAKAYRALGKPKLQTKSSFCFRAEQFSAEVGPAVLELVASQTGRFDEVLIDGKEIDIATIKIPDVWSKFEFTYKLSGAGEADVYQGFQELLIECKAIARGKLPKEIYLIDEDVCSQGEGFLDSRLENLSSICQLIMCLADLAHYHDEKLRGEEYKLIFVEDDGAKGAKNHSFAAKYRFRAVEAWRKLKFTYRSFRIKL